MFLEFEDRKHSFKNEILFLCLVQAIYLYGFHIEETEFCQKVCDEFKRRHPDSPDNIRVLKLDNSVSAFTPKHEKVQKEISDIIEKYSPDIVLDIHHSLGHPKNTASDAISVTYLNSQIDSDFARYLDGLDGVEVFPCTSTGEDSSTPIIMKAANSHNTRFLSVEIRRNGRMLDFPENSVNQQIFEKSACFLSEVYTYCQRH